ncbi:hypothetical protein [Streptomyces sp. NPDC047071]|uniref:hypothetical protein n=1 Tax=Streptomyces sp. NPDC047071 TaxID=3154808 RepID=UPI0034556428
MKFSSKITTGVVTVASAAAVALVAAPANATVSKAAEPVVAKPGSGVFIAGHACTDWHMAGGIPFKWSPPVSNGCATFGHPGFKQGYVWKATRGRPCVKVVGYTKSQKKKWYNAGCGTGGRVKVPWGNAAAEKQIKIKGASLVDWR